MDNQSRRCWLQETKARCRSGASCKSSHIHRSLEFRGTICEASSWGAAWKHSARVEHSSETYIWSGGWESSWSELRVTEVVRRRCEVPVESTKRERVERHRLWGAGEVQVKSTWKQVRHKYSLGMTSSTFNSTPCFAVSTSPVQAYQI